MITKYNYFPYFFKNFSNTSSILSNSLTNCSFSLSKKVSNGQQTLNLLLKGVNCLADAVQSTLGPKGKNVIISSASSSSPPKITKDGVTVAKAIKFNDPFLNLGAKLIKESSKISAKKVGDGTTTATILTREIFREGLKSINSGMNQIEICKGIVYSLKKVKDYLNKKSLKITNKNEIEKVATISANNDKEIGKIISQIFDKIGIDGAINVQKGNKLKHEVVFREGIQIDSGYISSYFINENNTQKCILENPYIYLTSKKIENIEDILNIFEFCLKRQRPLLLICDDIESEILATAIINKLKGILKVCIIKAPLYGERKINLLDDLALLTGGKVIDNEMNNLIKANNNNNINNNNNLEAILGNAKNVIVSKDNTLIIEGGGDKNKLKERIISLKNDMQNLINNNKSVEDIKKRIQKLNGIVALFKIGGINETEVNELKDRIDDSICATKAAIEEGIIPGGGVSLLYASKELENIKLDNYEQDHGLKIVRDALKIPIKIICKNAGINGDIVVNDLLNQNNENLGINALTGKKENLLKSGIIDPTKVVKTAIESAIKVANMMLRTETAIVEFKDEANKVKI